MKEYVTLSFLETLFKMLSEVIKTFFAMILIDSDILTHLPPENKEQLLFYIHSFSYITIILLNSHRDSSVGSTTGTTSTVL